MVGLDAPRRVHLAHLLPLEPGEREELLQQARFTQCELAVVLVQVERASLVPGDRIRSTTTLFAHFPSKEALVFDRDAEVEAELTAAVRERPAGQGVVEALPAHALTSWVRTASDPRRDRFTALVEQAPALREYGERMWMRHAGALSAVIAEELGREADDLARSALARFVLEIPALATGRHDPRATVETVFDLLIHGWQSQHGSGDATTSPHKG